jgi:hypothetical protein
MWSPQTWHELENLIGVAEESSGLDFKGDAPGEPREVAKDIAAMAANGGVLVYGVEEDKDTAVATAISPFPIRGVEERLCMIAGTRVTPTVSIDITVIRAPDDPTKGIVAVAVPASANAPHQANGRFPVRFGTTTRDLSEPEVERLYRQRWELSAGALTASDALDAFELPPGVTDEQARMLTHWVGRLRAVVTNAAHTGANHPEYPDYYAALRRAWAAARLWTFEGLTTGEPKALLAALQQWRPNATVGWAAGNVEIPDDGTDSQARYGAVLAYPSTFSFWLSWPLRIGADPGYCCAYEWRVAAQLMTVLVLAGRFLLEIPGVGPISCAIELGGFDEAVASSATKERPDIAVIGLPAAPPHHVEGLVTSAGFLVSNAAEVTRELLARWLIAFHQGKDLIESITP